MTWDDRHVYRCDVCQNTPDEHGMIEHGRGCYTQSSDGGGESFVHPWPPVEWLKQKAVTG